jgi:hypothetical protein
MVCAGLAIGCRLADGVRFELTVALPLRQFSRLEP